MKESERDTIAFKNNLPEMIEAPIRKGEKIGTGEVYLGDLKVGQVNLIATENIEKHSLGNSFDKIIKEWLKFVC